MPWARRDLHYILNGTDVVFIFVLPAGDRELYDASAAPLDAMGKARFYLGEVGAGARMKLVVNMIMVRHVFQNPRCCFKRQEGTALMSGCTVAERCMMLVVNRITGRRLLQGIDTGHVCSHVSRILHPATVIQHNFLLFCGRAP